MCQKPFSGNTAFKRARTNLSLGIIWVWIAAGNKHINLETNGSLQIWKISLFVGQNIEQIVRKIGSVHLHFVKDVWITRSKKCFKQNTQKIIQTSKTHVLECFFLFLQIMSWSLQICLGLSQLIFKLLHFLFKSFNLLLGLNKVSPKDFSAKDGHDQDQVWWGK